MHEMHAQAHAHTITAYYISDLFLQIYAAKIK